MILLAGSLLGGLVLLLALAWGWANPPVAGSLQARLTPPNEWHSLQHDAALTRYEAPLNLPDSAITLHAEATNTGPAESAWGVWLELADGELFILVNNEGYLSISRQAEPAWAGFRHIRPGASNPLRLHIEADGSASLRIQHELAWQESLMLAPSGRWGVLSYRQPHIEWGDLLLFAP